MACEYVGKSSGDAIPEWDDVKSIEVNVAEGEKCQRCWKILPDVGTHTHAGVCGRCDEALK